eukprot:GFKZ01014342.1.p2 GENE.GFKZ01014342.1~~GFKZ01014342.1.p2  ORF type:complete len:150 (-),score=11.77 GFKZ01014342.1:850-1299(-)
MPLQPPPGDDVSVENFTAKFNKTYPHLAPPNTETPANGPTTPHKVTHANISNTKSRTTRPHQPSPQQHAPSTQAPNHNLPASPPSSAARSPIQREQAPDLPHACGTRPLPTPRLPRATLRLADNSPAITPIDPTGTVLRFGVVPLSTPS